MGAGNAMAVYTHWTHLPHRERVLLLYLALVSMDGGTPPVYFGGWQAGARALGHDPDEKPDNAREYFRRSMAALRNFGVLVPNGSARQGCRAEYALTLDPLATARPTITKNGTGRPVTTWAVVHREDPRPASRGTGAVPLRGTGAVPHLGHRNGGVRGTEAVPPKRTEEELQEYSQENITEATTSPVPVDNSAKADEIPESVYGPASQFLGGRPDLGQTFLDQARTLLGQDADRRVLVVKAAEIAGWTPPKEVAA